MYGHSVEDSNRQGAEAKLPSPPPEFHSSQKNGDTTPSNGSMSSPFGHDSVSTWRGFERRRNVFSPEIHMDPSFRAAQMDVQPWSRDARASTLTPPASSLGSSASAVGGQVEQSPTGLSAPSAWVFPYPVPCVLPYNTAPYNTAAYPVTMPRPQIPATPPASDAGGQMNTTSPAYAWPQNTAAYIVSCRFFCNDAIEITNRTYLYSRPCQ